MKSKKILAALLTLSLTMSMVFTGCGNAGKSTGDAAEDGKENIDKEQYVNLILVDEPKTIDQSKSTDLYSSQVLTNVNEALTRLTVDEDGKDKVIEAGAESWEKSEDGLKWTFKLRDMKWSDGQPVTAEQYVYGITRTLNPEVASPYAFLLYPIKNAQAYNGGKAKLEDVGIKKIDDKTLEFTLENPCSYFLDLTYFKVMQPQRQDIVEKFGDKYGTDANTMVFCGPFVIKEWVHNNKVELEKNPEYWDAENVKLEKATMKIIKDENARMNEIYNGSLDLCTVTKPEWIGKLDKMEAFEVKKSYDGSTTYTMFNTNDKYFKNKKIRKAYAIAKDREGSCSTLYRDLAEPATAWCPPAVKIGDVEFREKIKFNALDEIKKENSDPKALLIEGLKEEGLDPDPSKHTFKYLESGTSATHKQFAEFEQQNVKEALGVNVTVDYVDWPIFQDRTKQLDFQIASQAWGGDYNDPMTFFDMWMSTAGIVPTGWKSEKYDELIKKTTETMDTEERAKLFAEAEKLLLVDDAVITQGVWRFKNTYIRKFVKGYVSPTFGTPDLKNVYTSGRE
ncbi:peptide ABC transporter substrate-binding protein [Clostridium sp. ATCC 25772]|uniref:peptide ABC transporter substrate-binding protein n=1 Tax=Clostridium sp. ATCC 25772 TaxID=1676991 RepID=UPI000780ABBA|nr:peptide ABC transporter substrate-binding protein [Clostridium sp. ATCC 25772]